MKKIAHFVVLILIVVGCKKLEIDYRSKYLGNFNLSIHATTHIIGSQLNIDTLYSKEGKISYGSKYNTIILSSLNLPLIETFVYEDGTLDGCLGCGFNTQMQGEFLSTKRIVFDFTTGGLGSSTTYDVIGEK